MIRNIFCSLFVFLCAQPTLSEARPGIKLEAMLSNGIKDPVLMVQAPESQDRWYIVEQRGVIRILENGTLQAKPFLDIEDTVVSGGEMGLLGLAFHPDFKRNGRYFINYTSDTPELRTVIAEYRVDGTPGRMLLEYRQPYSNHNGGHLAFGPDGYLYIASGDGGSAADPHGHGQNRNSLLGKILRIDVNAGSPYGIPKDNPFIKEASTRKEVFAYGLRNPWRFSFDKLTGAIFTGDVGQDRVEEVDLIEKGKNYGWNTMEGTLCFKPKTGCNKTGLELPLVEYPRSQGTSITGGYVYRGKAIPELQGVYVYGDFGSGKIWGLTYNQTTRKVEKNELLLNTRLPIASFGEDANGELYVVGYQGILYRIVASTN